MSTTAERVGAPPVASTAIASAAPQRALEMEVEVDGDPARAARIISALVNSSALWLSEARVGDVALYPRSSPETPAGATMTLTLRLRDHSRRIDPLDQEEMVAIVSRRARVLDARRIP